MTLSSSSLSWLWVLLVLCLLLLLLLPAFPADRVDDDDLDDPFLLLLLLLLLLSALGVVDAILVVNVSIVTTALPIRVVYGHWDDAKLFLLLLGENKPIVPNDVQAAGRETMLQTIDRQQERTFIQCKYDTGTRKSNQRKEGTNFLR